MSCRIYIAVGLHDRDCAMQLVGNGFGRLVRQGNIVRIALVAVGPEV